MSSCRTSGNDHTGDISAITKKLCVRKIRSNWVTGTFKGLKVQAKVYSEPSKYGIAKGRVSKLVVYNPDGGKEYLSYDRGWDIRPQTKPAKEILTIIKRLK